MTFEDQFPEAFYDKETGIECYADVEDMKVRVLADEMWLDPDTAERFAKAILKCVDYIRKAKHD